jgi:hypothetical protein
VFEVKCVPTFVIQPGVKVGATPCRDGKRHDDVTKGDDSYKAHVKELLAWIRVQEIVRLAVAVGSAKFQENTESTDGHA